MWNPAAALSHAKISSLFSPLFQFILCFRFHLFSKYLPVTAASFTRIRIFSVSGLLATNRFLHAISDNTHPTALNLGGSVCPGYSSLISSRSPSCRPRLFVLVQSFYFPFGDTKRLGERDQFAPLVRRFPVDQVTSVVVLPVEGDDLEVAFDVGVGG